METTPSRPVEMKRELRLLDATMLVIGSMIGSGIFIVSADIARLVGSPGWLLVVWGLTGFITILAALSYSELAGMMPQAGGQYVYLREAYNPMMGFLYGWTLFLVIQSGSIAAVGVAFAKYTAELIPALGEQNILLQIGAFKISAAQILAVVCIMFLSWLNMRGIREGKWVQDIFTIAKTAALLGLIVLGLTIGWNAEVVAANLSNFWGAVQAIPQDGGGVRWEQLIGIALPAAIGAAMVGSLFASDAWNNVTFTAGEIVNPKRTIALSLVLGTVVVIALYILANLSYLVTLPLVGDPAATDALGKGIQFAVSDRVATAAASTIFGATAVTLMAVMIMISTFGCNNGMILSGARVYYAMAKDGLFFKNVGTLNNRAVPAAALLFQGIWASILCFSGAYGDLLDYVIFAVMIFYILSVIGVFILRKKRPDAERPYKAFGYPVLPALYVILASAICIDLLIVKPKYTWPGMIIVLLGIPVYYLWKKKGQKSEV